VFESPTPEDNQFYEESSDDNLDLSPTKESDDNDAGDPTKLNIEVDDAHTVLSDAEEHKNIDNDFELKQPALVAAVKHPKDAKETVDDMNAESKMPESVTTESEPGSAPREKDVVGPVQKDRIYTLPEFMRLNKNPFRQVMFSMGTKTVTIDREPMLRLVMVLCRAFKHPGFVDLFLHELPTPDQLGYEVLSTLSHVGLQVIAACLRPYEWVSESTDMLNKSVMKVHKEPIFSTLKINPASLRLNLVDPQERPPLMDSTNVSDYISNVEGLRVSILFLSLFVNMGAYVDIPEDSLTPPCFFSQPSVNSRHLTRCDVNKYATDLYSKKCIYEYTEEVVIIPYCVSDLLDEPSGEQVDKIMSVALGESTPLVGEKEYVARWISDYVEVDYLFTFFMGESIDTMLPTWLPADLKKESVDAQNLCFCIFLEQLFEKYDGLSTREDWVGFYKHMEKKLELQEAFRYQDTRSIQWIWHRCHVMMCAITSLRVATGEGNHRMQSVFVAMFNLKLHQSINDLEKKAFLIQPTDLVSDDHVFQISRICKAATVSMSWPRVQKQSSEQEIFLPYELNMLKTYSALQQNKKDGSVSRAMINVVSSYLYNVRVISGDKAKYESDFSQVHIPGSKQYMLWNLEAVQESETLRMHKEAPNQVLKTNDKEKEVLTSTARKTTTKNETAKAANSANKYQNEDNSTGLDARAMVAFREHLLENILNDDCKEIVETRNNLLDFWSRVDGDVNLGFDPKNEHRPRKLPRGSTTPSILAKHIGYSWTIDRSIHGCLFVANLNPNSFRPKSLWPVVFLVTNFVHDEKSLDLMLQILQDNGHPQNASSPVDVTEILDYPSLFDATTRNYGPMLINSFLKPQMMLYDAFLSLFKDKFKEVGEVNIRNRYMLAIGKSWMRVVSKFGIWIESGGMLNIHSALRLFLSIKSSEFSHTPTDGKLGTNLPQLAAYVCYLITSDIFEWTSHSNMGGWTPRTGAFDTTTSPPPSYWEIFVPEFKFGSVARQTHKELADIPPLKIEDIVEFIILGTCKKGHLKTDKLTKNSKFWMNFTSTFTCDYCKQYIETNKTPVAKALVAVDSAFPEDDNTPKRPATKFRKKLFAVQEYKKHLTHGDNGAKDDGIKASTTKAEDIEEYQVRIDEMSTALLDAACYLRYQKALLTLHYQEKNMPNAWNPTVVMGVLQKRGGEESRPFYHPAYTRNLIDSHIDVEMKSLAHIVYKDIRSKDPVTSLKSAKAAILEASEATFKVSDQQYYSHAQFLDDKYQKKQEIENAAREEETDSPEVAETFHL